MNRVLKKLRGVVGTALTWAAGWTGLGLLHGLLLLIFEPTYRSPLLDAAFSYGVAGLAAGAGFGALLATLEGHEKFEGLSRKRLAIWGALGGALVPVVILVAGGVFARTGWGLGLAPYAALLGSISALATLWIGRRPVTGRSLRRNDFAQLSPPVPAWQHPAVRAEREPSAATGSRTDA